MARALVDRFEAKVDRSGEHHIWLGAVHQRRGTGHLKVAGKPTTAHRVAWELAHGPLGSGQRVLPCPDEPRCVKVEHLSVAGGDVSADSREGAAPAKRTRRAARGTGSKRKRGNAALRG